MRRKLLTIFIGLLTICCILPVHATDVLFDAEFTYIGTHDWDDEANTCYADQGMDTVHVQAWRNDTVYLKAALHAGYSAQVQVKAEDLQGESGVISQDHIELGWLRPTQASLGTGDNVYYAPHASVAEIITRETEFYINFGEPEYIWIEINVPSDAKAGLYETAVNISLDGELMKTLTIELDVLNMKLSDGPSMSLDLWQYPYSSLRYYWSLQGEEPFSPEHLEVLRKELQDYADLGGNAITVSVINEPWTHQTYDDYPSMVTWHKSDDGYMWYDYTQFDAWVKLCMELGIDERIDTFSILPWDGAVTFTLDDGTEVRYPMELGSQEWMDVWRGFLCDYMYHLNDMGWLDKTCIFVDEREMWQVEAAVNLIKNTTVEDFEPLKVGMAINRIPQNEPIFDLVDYVAVSIAVVPEDSAAFDSFMEHRRELGLETVMYTCSTTFPNSFAISNPDETIWTIEYLASRGFDGFLRWAYDAWTEDPLNTLDFHNFEAGDTLLYYPDEAWAEHPEGFASVRLKLLDQGMRNVKKIRYILSHGEENEAGKNLENEFLHMDRSYGNYNGYGAMVASSAQASFTISEQVSDLDRLIAEAEKELSVWTGEQKRIIYACE